MLKWTSLLSVALGLIAPASLHEAFDAQQAYNYTAQVAGFGERMPESPGHQKTVDLIYQVLKKNGAQIEADNINLGVSLLEKKLPDFHEEVDSGVTIVSNLLDEFKEHRDKFYTDNRLGELQDPTAKN